MAAVKRSHEGIDATSPAKRRMTTDTGFRLSASVPRGFLKSYCYRPEGQATDIPTLFTAIFTQLVTLMIQELEEHQFKATLVINVEFEKEGPFSTVSTARAYFRSRPMRILNEFEMPSLLKHAHAEIEKKIDQWVSEGSGWTVSRIFAVYLDVAKYSALRGSTYVDLPAYLKKKKAIINVKNSDNECLRRALLSALHPANDHSD